MDEKRYEQEQEASQAMKEHHEKPEYPEDMKAFVLRQCRGERRDAYKDCLGLITVLKKQTINSVEDLGYNHALDSLTLQIEKRMKL